MLKFSKEDYLEVRNGFLNNFRVEDLKEEVRKREKFLQKDIDSFWGWQIRLGNMEVIRSTKFCQETGTPRRIFYLIYCRKALGLMHAIQKAVPFNQETIQYDAKTIA